MQPSVKRGGKTASLMGHSEKALNGQPGRRDHGARETTTSIPLWRCADEMLIPSSSQTAKEILIG